MTLDWIQRAPAAPYFIEQSGRAWTPIGQNDAISWPDLAGLHHRRDLPAVERHLAWLAAQGVTCLRLMLEYAETGEHFFEHPAGTFDPAMVALWDDLFRLVEAAGLRILLTPLDTYFQWVRWDMHPYNVANGGPCADRTQLMTCPATRALIKARLAFVTERWGNTGALFAWDIWNEMHPVQGENRPDCFDDYIADVSPFLRDLEHRLHGRAHPQCVSVFGPELHWKPWLNAAIFRHPALDFASSHFYAEGTIDDPADTVAPALATARLTLEALAEITDQRPFFDSEHGPIHTFKDHRITLPEAFDDEYFRHIQWTHLACGGAGGGMRWPNRHPHVLTHGMRRAQRALADFTAHVDWASFDRRPLGDTLTSSDPDIAVFGCSDGRQAIVYALRLQPLSVDGRIALGSCSDLTIAIRNMQSTLREAMVWDTIYGSGTGFQILDGSNTTATIELKNFNSECAIVFRPTR